ncbi:hypothetical protein ACFT5C_29505 [Streptomyces sp. NPDC057116]|uniref:hypothetical protein n=1 Tax=Streptomyces sp. NPDC057116 TaxID=3346023 RepID=UPI0036380491
MRRIVPLALAVLLGATGCVSVPHTAVEPRPKRWAPAGDPAPSPVHWRPPAEPPAREELATIAPPPRPLPRPPRAPVRQDRRADPPPVRERAKPRPPARRAPAPVPERPRARPRPQPPAAHVPAPPRPSYGMRDVCRASQGVTDPSLTALCRQMYGR